MSLLVLAGVVILWPIPIDPSPSLSLKLYIDYKTGETAPVSEVLGPVDIACAVGPYDSFRDARFAARLTPAQIAAAEASLESRNLSSLGDNKIFLVGLRGSTVGATYASNFFLYMPGAGRTASSSKGCVDGNGMLVMQKTGSDVSIRLVSRD